MASDALSYIVQGLAQGAPQGFRLGLLAQEGQQRQQQIDAAKKAAVIEAEKEKQKMAIEKGKLILDGFKEAPSQLKPDYFKTFATFMNENFNAGLDPNGYHAGMDEDLSGITKLVDLRQQNKISSDDFFYGATKIMAGLDAKQQDRAKNVIQPLIDLERIRKTGEASAGEVLLGPFATKKVLKLSGLSDEEIEKGQASGVIPRQLKRSEAQLIIPRGINFNFGSLGHSGTADSLNADTVSSSYGF